MKKIAALLFVITLFASPIVSAQSMEFFCEEAGGTWNPTTQECE